MNMNKLKKINFIITILISFFVINIKVFADTCDSYACAKCTYSYGSDGKTSCVIEVKSDGKGKANITHNCSTSLNYTRVVWNGLSSANFVDKKNNTLKCPSSAFVTVAGSGRSVNIVMSFTNSKNAQKLSLNDNSSNSNGKPFNASDKDDKTSNYISCDYGYGITLRGNGTEIITESNGSYEVSANKLDPKDFIDKTGKLVCPYYQVFCQTRGMNICVISKSSETGVKSGTEAKDYDDVEKDLEDDKTIDVPLDSDDVTLKKCEDIDTKEKCDVNNCKWNKGTKKCENYYVAQDPCSENSIKKVLRFFGYLLLIAKVVIPLIIIGFGTFDLFKAITDKDEKSLVKQIKVLGIRIFTGIFVFFIPNLVYAVFGLTEKLNVIEQDKYKTCANCLLKPTSAECQIEEGTDDNSDNNSVDNSDNNTHQSSSGRTHGGTGGSF